MTFSTSTSTKTSVVLKHSDDWDEWFLIVSAMIKRDDIEKYVNLTKIELIESIKFTLSTFSNMRSDVRSSANLTENQRRDLTFLREDYKKAIRTYRKKAEVFKQLKTYILITVNQSNLLYLTDEDTVFRKLLVLKKRLTSSDRIRELEIIRKYRDLQKIFKNQDLNNWILNWEKAYAKTDRLELSDVQNHRCVYDFLNALRTVNMTFVADRETVLKNRIQRNENLSSIKDLLKNFRNHLRTNRTLSQRKTIHFAFVILNGETSEQSTASTDQKKSNQATENKICVCDSKHSHRKCYYLHSSQRSAEWKSNKDIETFIVNKLTQSSGLKKHVEMIQKSVREKKKKETKFSKSSFTNATTKSSASAAFVISSAFASEDKSFSYKLKNCWTLDCATDIHICNDVSRINIETIVNPNDKLVAEKDVYSINDYEWFRVTVKESNESKTFKLLNVIYAFEFMTNLVCLSKLIAKKIHWDTENNRLHHKKETFCYIQSVNEHWIVEYNDSDESTNLMFNDHETFVEPSLSSTTVAAFVASKDARPDLVAIDEKWHEMLSHSEPEIIANLELKVTEVKVINLPALIIEKCETCALTKAHQMMSRRTGQKESTDFLLERMRYDLISMIEAYNGDHWVSHFRNFFTEMNFVYSHSRKNDALDVIKEFFKMIRIRYDQIVRFLRIDDERTLRLEYAEIVKKLGISTERSASYTSTQNEESNDLREY